MTLTPAYGRDYKSAAGVRDAWNRGSDFIIADVTHPYSGKPVNRRDLANERGIYIRYAQLLKVTKVQ